MTQAVEKYIAKSSFSWGENNMADTTQRKIRPYARLLTMLGEQLITDERIAMVEIIKNSYDADADWIKVTFENFDENFVSTEKSKIIIEDNGCGMTSAVIEKHWLNPATPGKLNSKKEGKDTTPKGRIIQGEKGIGRFALLKLGKTIEVTTRPKEGDTEYVIIYDFEKYDNDFLTENGKKKELFLEDLVVSVTEREPEYFVKRDVTLGIKKQLAPLWGTRIEISNIKGSWTEKKVNRIFNDTTKLTSIFHDNQKNDFEIGFYRNNDHLFFQQNYLEQLNVLLHEQAVFCIEEGFFDARNMTFRYTINNQKQEISIKDPRFSGLKVFSKNFGDAALVLQTRGVECGSFDFQFYIFDFSSKAPVKYLLNRNQKNIIKEHRIYLYRDKVRVYPYGEPNDDWLQIDTYRGTISAGDFLSNDQVVGCINISQQNNPNLKDKTNREGLVDEGNATSDFIVLLQSFLSFVRQHPYKIYQHEQKSKKEQDIFRTAQVKSGFENLKTAAGDDDNLKKIIDQVEKDYDVEREYLVRRTETTEELAGVGLSVETASHDIMSFLNKALANLDDLIKTITYESVIDKDQLLKELQSIRGLFGFVESKIKDIQLLFKSSKQRRRDIRVSEIIEKASKIYNKILKDANIVIQINPVGSPLSAKTTDAVLLQLFLNLFDNAIYWLKQVVQEKKTIKITLDGDKYLLLFSDNGPGVHKDDAPYIFDAFFSGKGEDGRGLGLYIARQLLERQGYSINLAEISSEKQLSGANFVISFIAGGEE
ncbi:MAG: ATP-binding protein [Termitinemataceae bacterium]|nr:MAG: ATP-binding protein [Termitinemataceae bacterium]